MDVSNINSATLQNLVGLIKKKETLEAQLAKIDSQISATLGTKAPKAPKATKGPKVKTPAAPKAGRKRGGKRGALKDAIVSLLEKAGAAGLSAKEISKKLGIPNQHVHVWFGTTGKKVEGLSKPGKGVWALKSK